MWHSLFNGRLVLQRRGRPAHCLVVFQHLLFKVLSVVLYLFGWFLTPSFVASFILIMLLLSADFWIVKNVSGRLLAGLREDTFTLSWSIAVTAVKTPQLF